MPTQIVAVHQPVITKANSNYQDYVNPQWVSLLNLLGMNVEYERCFGSELFTKDGRRILDVCPVTASTTRARDVAETAETSLKFWTEALGMARRAANT